MSTDKNDNTPFQCHTCVTALVHIASATCRSGTSIERHEGSERCTASRGHYEEVTVQDSAGKSFWKAHIGMASRFQVRKPVS